MGILSRLVGGALVGPIGLVGPTEASKRSKKQLAELKKQTELLEAATRPNGQLSGRVAGSTAPKPQPKPKKATEWRFGDRVALNTTFTKWNTTIPVDAEGTIIEVLAKSRPSAGSKLRVAFDPYDDRTPGGIRKPMKGVEADVWPARLHHVTDAADGDDASDGHEETAYAEPSGNSGEVVEFKACPDCAEDVRYAARKCRFCGYAFTDAPPMDSSA